MTPATLSEVTRLADYAIFLRNYVVFVLEKFPEMKFARPGAAIALTGAVRMVAFRTMRPANAPHFMAFD